MMQQDKTRTGGFTMVELLVTIAIVIVLAGLAFTMVGRAMERAKLAGSVSQVRDLGVLVISYTSDHGGELPVWHDYNQGKYWWELITEEVPVKGREKELFQSPNHGEFDPEAVAQTISYGWNYPVIGRHKGDSSFRGDHVLRLPNFRDPSQVLVLCDGARADSWGFIDAAANKPDPERYGGKAAGFLLDGSIRLLQTPQEFGEDSEWFVPVKLLLSR